MSDPATIAIVGSTILGAGAGVYGANSQSNTNSANLNALNQRNQMIQSYINPLLQPSMNPFAQSILNFVGQGLPGAVSGYTQQPGGGTGSNPTQAATQAAIQGAQNFGFIPQGANPNTDNSIAASTMSTGRGGGVGAGGGGTGTGAGTGGTGGVTGSPYDAATLAMRQQIAAMTPEQRQAAMDSLTQKYAGQSVNSIVSGNISTPTTQYHPVQTYDKNGQPGALQWVDASGNLAPSGQYGSSTYMGDLVAGNPADAAQWGYLNQLIGASPAMQQYMTQPNFVNGLPLNQQLPGNYNQTPSSSQAQLAPDSWMNQMSIGSQPAAGNGLVGTQPVGRPSGPPSTGLPPGWTSGTPILNPTQGVPILQQNPNTGPGTFVTGPGFGTGTGGGPGSGSSPYGSTMYNYAPIPQSGYSPTLATAPGQVGSTGFDAPVGSQALNTGQDALMQLFRGTPGGPNGPGGSADPFSYQTSDLFSAIDTAGQRQLDQQVAALQGSAGSLGQRFGSAMTNAESNLRQNYLANTNLQKQQIGYQDFTNALSTRIGAANQLSQQGLAQGSQNQNMLAQFAIANPNIWNQANQFNSQLGQQNAQFNAGQGNNYNNLILGALSQAANLQGAQTGQNTGLISLLAGLQVPQQQPSPWPGAIGNAASTLTLLPFLNQAYQSGQQPSYNLPTPPATGYSSFPGK